MARQRTKTGIEHAAIVRRFASRLRELRLAQGMTQAELAERSDITVSYVWRLETAGSAPGIDLLGRLAAALSTSPHDLLPADDRPDATAALSTRVRTLFDRLMADADQETLALLAPLLARLLAGSPTGR